MRKITPESPKEKYGEMSSPSSQTAKTIYPSTNFDNKTLPEAADWKVGKTYRVTLDIKMRGISHREGGDGKARGNYDFDIVGVDVTGEAPKGKAAAAATDKPMPKIKKGKQPRYDAESED